ncbi:MAG: hypothetical protein GY913_29715 [Proteobacteria bacterium]|nr:hypothetical protein [Pseudomonadota bacterium]MCP4921093.1 hypothetical protein [Pseudomonadota bacterium]
MDRLERLRPLLPVLAVLGVPTAVMFAMYWPLPLHPYSWYDPTAFGGAHVWSLDYMGGIVRGEHALGGLTDEMGYPGMRQAQFLAWLPALIAMPLSAIWGPLGAYNMQVLFAPAIAAGFTAAWVRRATDADGWTAALAGCLYGLSPYMLATLSGGNIDKIQIGFYPCWLLLAWTLLHARRGWLVLPLFPLMGAAMAFTEPYFGLFLPLFAGPLLMLRSAWRRSLREGAWSFLALSLTGAGMVPAKSYYAMEEGMRGPLQMFQPSVIMPGIDPPMFQEPVATLRNLLIRPFAIPDDPSEVVHVSTLGLPLLIGLMVVLIPARRYRQARELGFWLLVAGIGLVVAIGSQLMIDGSWQTSPFSDGPFHLPMELLERVGYPLAKGGQYYRANPIIVLGLVTALAAGVALLDRRWKQLAWLILPLNLVHGFWASASMFPRSVEPYPGYEVLREAGADTPTDDRSGAGSRRLGVIALPAFGSQAGANARVIAGALTGLPITARAVPLHYSQEGGGVPNWVREIERGELRANEFSYLVLFKTHDASGEPEFLREPALRAWLGEPRWDTDEVAVWDLYVRNGRRPKGF